MLLWQEKSLLRGEEHRTTPPGAAAQHVLTRFKFLRHGHDDCHCVRSRRHLELTATADLALQMSSTGGLQCPERKKLDRLQDPGVQHAKADELH